MRQRSAQASATGSAPQTAGLITALCLLGVALATVTASGCGHPASREECVLILKKSAELKLRHQNIQDPQLIELRTRELMDARGDGLIDKCVGRTVTKSALDCVQRAESEAAVDKCLY